MPEVQLASGIFMSMEEKILLIVWIFTKHTFNFNEFPQRHTSVKLPLPAFIRQTDYLFVLPPIY